MASEGGGRPCTSLWRGNVLHFSLNKKASMIQKYTYDVKLGFSKNDVTMLEETDTHASN